MKDDSINPGFDALQPYPFERLTTLLQGITPADKSPIALSIGEPRHAPPEHVLKIYREHLLEGVSRYPTIRGIDSLRLACSEWLQRRFALSVDAATMIQPVNGTREALFAVAQAFVHHGRGQKILMPNPFYQIYEGAALMAGASPHYLSVSAQDNYLPDLDSIDEATYAQAQIFYLCSPVNPCGSVASLAYLSKLVSLAQQHQFVIAADECYIELYRDAPPVSILNACSALGDDSFKQVLAFHSLSKRSNLPGMRSGFVAGDPDLIRDFTRYRTYHGCSMSLAVQHASAAAWGDDHHVVDNRRSYNIKYDLAKTILDPVLNIDVPAASFYLWPDIEGDDERFCRDLYAEQNVVCVPGSYLSRDVDGHNPGRGFVRMSLVADEATTAEALSRISDFLKKG